jgi:hypothetical protein
MKASIITPAPLSIEVADVVLSPPLATVAELLLPHSPGSVIQSGEPQSQYAPPARVLPA